MNNNSSGGGAGNGGNGTTQTGNASGWLDEETDNGTGGDGDGSNGDDSGGNGSSDSTNSGRTSGNSPAPWNRSPSRSNSESDDKSDDLSNTEKALAFGAGGTAGELFAFATPDNWEGSPFYLLGQVISNLIPGPVGVIKDAQALLNSILDGDLAGIVLNGVALIPGLGSIAEGSQILKTMTKWADDFPASTDDALDLFMPLVKHMPDSVSMTIMAKFADGPVKSLRKGGMSADNILKYKRKGYDLRQIENLRIRGISPSAISKYVDEGYSPRQISLMTDSGFKPGDMKKFLDEGYDFGKIYKLHNKGIPKGDIRKYVDEGIPLHRVSALRKQGIPADDIRYYVDEGVDIQRVADLRKSHGISAANIRKYAGEGTDLRRVKRLRKQDVPAADIETYVDKGVSLKRVSKLRHMGIPADDVKYYATAGATKKGTRFRLALAEVLSGRLGRSPKETRDVIEKIKPGEYALTGGSTYKEVNEWCQKNPEDAEGSFVCRTLPSVPTKEQQNGNESGGT